MESQARKVGRPAKGPQSPRTCLCCSRPARVRGLCWTDYQAARRQVVLQNTTWERLESIGLVLPSRRGQGRKPNAFMAKWEALGAKGEGRRVKSCGMPLASPVLQGPGPIEHRALATPQ